MRPPKSTWTDMSEFVVHFTKPKGTQSDYDCMMGIWGCASIWAINAFGIIREKAPDPDSQKVVCFSEVPLHMLERLAQRRGGYGIGFKKEFIVARGGGPVLYAYKDTPHWEAVRELIDRAGDDKDDPVWKLTPFVEAPGEYGTKPYFFEWEREWRHVGPFPFRTSDVAFLIIPEHHHDDAKNFFHMVGLEGLGPSYDCPYIDAHWDLDAIRESLAPKPPPWHT